MLQCGEVVEGHVPLFTTSRCPPAGRGPEVEKTLLDTLLCAPDRDEKIATLWSNVPSAGSA